MRSRSLVLVLASAALTCGPKQQDPIGPTGGGGTSGGGGTVGGGGTSAGGGGGAVTPTGPSTPRPANAVDVSLAEVGLEAASLDRKADPCIDFYQYACGGWVAKNPIPPDRARWGRFAELDERNENLLKQIVEEAATGKLGSDAVSKKIGDYYTSCMDEAAIEKKGTAGVKPLLDAIAKVKDAKTWFKAVVTLHRYDLPVVWNIFVEPDQKDSTKNALYLDSGGLGLPDRDYYVDAKFKEKVDTYKAHVARTLELGGTAADKTQAGADDVLAIETELAKVTKTRVERRDPITMYNPVDRKALKGKTSASIDWNAYFKQLGFDPGKRLVVTTPPYFKAIDKLRKQFKPAQWQSYLRYHVLHDLAFSLPKKFDDEAFALTKAISGVEQQRARYKRCIDAVSVAMPEYLAQPFVKRAFPGESKAAAEKMVDAISVALGEDIQALPWMSDTTKKEATVKLGKLAKMIGFPDKWKSYDYAVKRDDFAGNRLRAAGFEAKRQRAKAGKPYDRNEWLMAPYEVNAYYNPSANNSALPAGILQPPFFGKDRGVAANMGGIGMVIGHELTHGFDDQGAQYDAEGNLKNWWQKEDLERFQGKGKCVSKQYSTFEVLPKQTVNGDLTLGENIADLGGVKMAFNAYRKIRAGAEKSYIADGLNEDQQFFVAVAQAWCTSDRKQEAERRLTVDPHSPPKFRVYGSLRNLPEFAKAFSCSPGTPMNPAQSCQVW